MGVPGETRPEAIFAGASLKKIGSEENPGDAWGLSPDHRVPARSTSPPRPTGDCLLSSQLIYIFTFKKSIPIPHPPKTHTNKLLNETIPEYTLGLGKCDGKIKFCPLEAVHLWRSEFPSLKLLSSPRP